MKVKTWSLAVCALFAALPARALYQDEVLADNPVAYWRLGELSGDAAADVMGQHHGVYMNGVVLGQPGALAGDPDASAVFSAGAETKVEAPYSAALNPSVFSVECWAKATGNAGVYRSALTSRNIVTPGNFSAGYIFYAGNNNRWQFWTGQGTTSWNNMQGPTVVLEEWVHLVGTYDGATKRFYVNGVQVASADVPFLANESSLLRIGGGVSENPDGQLFFEGGIDEVAVYNTVLSEERVAAHYEAGVTSTFLPVIHVPPENTTGFINQPITLSVTASGQQPLQYQWKFNGDIISGATQSAYMIESATLDDAGLYSVRVFNAVGETESEPVFVSVLDIHPPVIEEQPQSLTLFAGATARFSVQGSGGANLEYQWEFNGADLPGETSATLEIQNVQPAAHQGTYQVRLVNEAGPTPSEEVTLTVLVAQPGSYAALVLEDAPRAYWRLGEESGDVAHDFASGFNGVYMNDVALGQPGALVDDADTAAGFNGFQSRLEVPFTPELNQPPFTVELWAKVAGNDGVYRAAISSRDDIPQRGYVIYAGSNNRWQFWTGTGSAWDTLTGPLVVNEQWTHLAATYDGTTKRFYVNGLEAASSTLPFAPNAARNLRIGAGINEVEFGDLLFFFGDLDEVAFYDHALSAGRIIERFGAGVGATRAPEIVTQPASRVVLAGATVELSVAATGSLPLEYQWQFEGGDLLNETNAALVLNDVGPATAGTYQVIVRNPAGELPSDEVTVTVIEDVPYHQAVLEDNPVAYWRLGEMAGQSVAVDQTGNHPGNYLNGVQLGRPGALSGDSDTAAGFLAADQTKIEAPYSAALNPPVFSIECWAKATGNAGVYRSALTSRNIITPGNLTAGYIFYAGNNNRWQFWTGQGTTGWNNMQGPNVVFGEWVHLAGTYDGATKRFYVNGVQVASADVPFLENEVSLLRIGGGASENPVGQLFFEGDLDEVAVYNTALSLERVQTRYILGARPSAEPPTIAIQLTAEGIVLTWSDGILEEAGSVTGEWTEVSGAESPLTVAPSEEQKYYRVRQ